MVPNLGCRIAAPPFFFSAASPLSKGLGVRTEGRQGNPFKGVRPLTTPRQPGKRHRIADRNLPAAADNQTDPEVPMAGWGTQRSGQIEIALAVRRIDIGRAAKEFFGSDPVRLSDDPSGMAYFDDGQRKMIPFDSQQEHQECPVASDSGHNLKHRHQFVFNSGRRHIQGIRTTFR